MLPVVSEEMRNTIEGTLQGGEDAWKREMVHRLKEENPEINTLLLELAQQSQDPKMVIKAGYVVYSVLELALKEENAILGGIE